MAPSIHRLSDALGARVDGVDLSRPLAPEAFARRWGPPEPHVDFSRPRTLWRITIRDCEASAVIERKSC